MIKLLKGELVRLFKSKIFWLCTIFMFGFASMAVYTKWNESRLFPDHYNPPDGILLAGAVYISIVIAVFVGIFIGTDHSSGTIRNKHVMGHSRAAMYLSDLITCVTAAVIMHAVYIAVIVTAAVFGITRGFEMSAGNAAAQILTSFFSVSAISAILLFVSMLISSRSAGVVSAIVLSLVLIITAGRIDTWLREEEYTTNYNITVAADGELLYSPQGNEKNPRYITGTKRKVLEFLNDALPVDQISQMIYGTPSAASEDEDIEEKDNSAWFPLYSLSLAAIVTTAGIIIFRKKDLK